MSTDTRSTVKIVTFLLMLSAAALLLLAVAAGVAFNHRARADTIAMTISPFAIDGVQPAEVYVAELTGPGAFQAIYFDGTRNVYLSAVEGFPCLCRPAGQLQVYGLGDFSDVGFGMDLHSTAVAFGENTITLTDSEPIRTHPGDFNGDGTTGVQDIFDFLTDSVAGTTSISVADFIVGYFAPPPSLTVCPCSMDDYPFSIHPQGMANDECYEHYKHKVLSAWQEFLIRAEDCRLPNSICYNCSCLFNRYMEYLALANEYWRECGE